MRLGEPLTSASVKVDMRELLAEGQFQISTELCRFADSSGLLIPALPEPLVGPVVLRRCRLPVTAL